MCESYENSKRTRHIDTKYQIIKDLVCKELIQLNYIRTNENTADIFTKSLSKVKFVYRFKNQNLK